MAKILLRGDSLDRGRYARSLYRIIGDYQFDAANSSIHKPMTNSDNKAFVLAVSAPWGTGKTYFMDIFGHVLKCDKNYFDDGYEEFDKSISFKPDNVMQYDAWENDFWDNAFEPLFDKLINSDLLRSANSSDIAAAGRSLSAAGDSIIAIFKTLGVFNTSSKFIAEILNAVKESGNDWSKVFEEDAVKASFHDYSVFRNAVGRLKEELANTVKATGKIAIIIDELDRCKPAFAVQTLEIIKHLFNVPGIVFIFSLDIIQLQHCVKAIYGNEFDAVGYLERFFDYTSLLPQGNLQKLFNMTAAEFNITASEETMQVYYEVCSRFHLSVREIRAVCSAFYYLDKFELNDYPDYAKQLYFYLLAMKYKEPVRVMQAISASEESKTIRDELLNKYRPLFSPPSKHTKAFEEAFSDNPIIVKYNEYSVIENSGFCSEAEMYAITSIEGHCKSNMNHQICLTQYQSLSFVIYKPDFGSEEMLHLRLLEYLFRKVELYDTI